MSDVLFLNLPNKEQITRRYMCSYISPESLFPPLELLYLAGIARDTKGLKVSLLDAIAEKKTPDQVQQRINIENPEYVVTILGLECIEEDCLEIKKIKLLFPEKKIVVFGHYATQFPSEVLQESNADYLILGEPDIIFSNLLDVFYKNLSLKNINGLVYLKEGKTIKQGEDKRIPNPNELPRPAYDLLPVDKYYEPVLKRPYSMIQTARGCPYPCTFCVKSYGSKLTIQSPERVVEEIEFLVKTQGIKSLRFIDDTFTVNKKRVIAICEQMLEKNLDIEWCCLSRADNLNEEVLIWMKRSGCKRIYFGLESGSQRILDLYKKRINVSEALETLLLCKNMGIETTGFFMSGYPEETEEDFDQTIDFAKRAKLTYASVNPINPYPGTALFDELKDQLEFSLIPYKNQFKNPKIADVFTKRKKKFYKAFYLRPNYIIQNAKSLLFNSQEIFSHASGLINYLFFNGKFVISGLKGPNDN